MFVDDGYDLLAAGDDVGVGGLDERPDAGAPLRGATDVRPDPKELRELVVGADRAFRLVEGEVGDVDPRGRPAPGRFPPRGILISPLL